MTRTNGIPVGADVRERLRVAQRTETEAIAAVQKALVAEADTRARLDQVIIRHRAELSKAALAVQEAQAALVRTSGLERAAALLDVTSKALRAAVREAKQETRAKPASNHAPAPHTAPERISQAPNAAEAGRGAPVGADEFKGTATDLGYSP